MIIKMDAAGESQGARERRLELQTASLKDVADARENELNQLREFCEAERTASKLEAQAAKLEAQAAKVEAQRMTEGYTLLKQLLTHEGCVNSNRKAMLENATRVIANIDN